MKACQGRMVNNMKFKIEIGENRIEEYFEEVDWIKKQMLEYLNKDIDMVNYYQAKLDEYNDIIDSIIIERG